MFCPHTGDSFTLRVPFNQAVGPAPPGELNFSEGLSLKEMIAEATGVAPASQRLMCRRVCLNHDHETINYYDICHGTTVVLSLRPPAGFGRNPVLATTLGLTTRPHKKLVTRSKSCQLILRWRQEECPNLFHPDKLCGREDGTLGIDNINFFDYVNAGTIADDMGHGDPFGEIRKTFSKLPSTIGMGMGDGDNMAMVRSGYRKFGSKNTK